MEAVLPIPSAPPHPKAMRKGRATITGEWFALWKLRPTTREAHSAPLGATVRLENEDYALLAPAMRFKAVEAQDPTSEGRILAQR